MPRRATATSKGGYLQTVTAPAGADGRLSYLINRQQRITESAVNTLLGILESQKAKDTDRIAAARELLDRLYGKPAMFVQQDVHHYSDTQAALHQYSVEELEAMIQQAKIREGQVVDIEEA